MCEVDNSEIGRDPGHDALTEGDGIVDDSEFGYEDYRWRRLLDRILRQAKTCDQNMQANDIQTRAPILLPVWM